MSHPRISSALLIWVLFSTTFSLLSADVSASTAQSHQTALRAAASGNGSILRREVFGFALASSLTDATFGQPTWNFSLLSTVAYFGLHVQDDGTFAGDQGWTVWNSASLTNLVSTAHSHGTKVVLTIILQDFNGGTPHMCSGLAHSATTVTNTVNEAKAKGVDGVNVDYEGLNGSCGTGDSSAARHSMTNFVASLRSSLPAGSYLSVDTYASSASDPIGFYDITGLNPNVDSFFVMAYDLEYSNWSRPPASCSSFCLGPTAPLNGYYYNATSTADQYVNAVASSKVLLGVPYYGRKSCVAGAAPNAYPVGNVVADTYLDAVGESTAPEVKPGSFAAHRDGNDPAGQERWDSWFNTSMNCWRELYWDDTVSLGLKYDLINRDNLRGVGIWNLNYGGGAQELWQLLSDKFASTTVWNSLGGSLTSGPGASSWAPSHTDAFVRGLDNQLYHDWFNGTNWSGFQALGGQLTSDPSAVAWGANRIDVFIRGTDNQLWHTWWDGVRFNPWQPLGGSLTSGPDAASWGINRLDVFARGLDNQLWHTWWDGVRWNAWQPLGGNLTSDPTVVSWGANRIDVFGRGLDNQLWHTWWDGVRWNAWQPLGGYLTSGPEVSSCAPGHLDIFALGGDSTLYQLGWNGSAWVPWKRLGGQWASDPAAVCPPGTTSAQVFARGQDQALWQTSVPAT